MIKRYYHYILIALALVVGIHFYKKYRVMPDLEILKLGLTDENQTEFNARSVKGKYVLVSYFQSWCGACATEVPSMVELQKKLGKEKLEVLLISDEDFIKINNFKMISSSELPFYKSAKLFKELGVHVFPSTYLINPAGKILLSKMEGYNWNSEEVEGLIK